MYYMPYFILVHESFVRCLKIKSLIKLMLNCWKQKVSHWVKEDLELCTRQDGGRYDIVLVYWFCKKLWFTVCLWSAKFFCDTVLWGFVYLCISSSRCSSDFISYTLMLHILCMLQSRLPKNITKKLASLFSLVGGKTKPKIPSEWPKTLPKSFYLGM